VLALLVAQLGRLQAATTAPLPAGTLPVASTNWVSSGQASASKSGNTLTINQNSSQAILNWQSFNIARGSTVNFVQPSNSAQVLNRIADASPSVIQGALQANGRVYLINQNGIVFGNGAQVNVGALVASSLDVSDDVFLSGVLTAYGNGLPAFSGATGYVRVESGASITTPSGGQVWLFAPSIENSGVISTPDGQTLLAAGNKVYLNASDDAAMRGVLVEVGSGGSVLNLGQVVAERGNITLAGLAVNQSGRLTASTTVSRNGSIWLQAVEKADDTTGSSAAGTLTLASGSVTEVLPETASVETSTDAQTFLKSQVQASGHVIDMQDGALIHAASGDVTFDSTGATTSTSAARIYVGSDAVIDVAGLTDVVLPMSRNFLQVRLTSNELADSALQKSGFLLGQTVTVDLREGTSLADVSAAIAQIGRTVGERSTTGGTITMKSTGDVVLREGSTLDVSGGAVHYDAGWGSATQLVSADGRIVDIGKASADQVYIGLANQTTVTHGKWGVTTVFNTSPSRYNAAFVDGQDAGTISITAPAMVLDGTLLGNTTAGTYQRTASTLAKGGKLVLAQSSDAADYAAALRMAASASRLDSSFDVDSVLPTEQANTLTIDTTSLARGGFTRLDFTSAGDITLDASVNLNLGVGGSLSLKQAAGYAGNIVIGGQVTAAGGSIGVTSVGSTSSGDIVLQDGARLDVAGLWTNDNAALTQATRGSVATTGGSVSLQAARGLDLQGGSVIDVSGGAWYSAAGKLTAGSAGTITLAASRGKESSAGNQADGALVLGGSLLGYGLKQGGTLNLRADGFALGSAAPASDLSGATSADTVLPLSFFSSGGFNTFSLTAWDRQSILSDVLAPVVSNWVLPTDYTLRASSAHLASVAGTGVLPAVQRQAVSLTLPLSELSTGAAIVTDAGGAITINGGPRVLIDGLIRAPGGSITVNQAGVLPGSLLASDFDSSQALWLGSHAVLDASGTATVALDRYGHRSGSVLAGGSISLNATNAYIVTEAGSVIDVSGTTATLDLPTATASGTLYAPRVVSSSAGSVSLSSNTGLLLAGQMRAEAPTATDQGGTLSITLTPDTNNVLVATRSLQLQTDAPAWPTGLSFGEALSTAAPLGQAVVSTNAIEAAGFDVVNLKSWDELRFSGDTALRAGRSISLSAPHLVGDSGASLQLVAPYVSLGNADGQRQAAASTSTTGDATLTVQAQTIDVIGSWASQGLARTELQADGDIRLRGVLDTTTEHNSTNTSASTALVGAYTTSGNVVLQAAQVYPTTLSQYTLTVTDASAGVALLGNSASATSAAPLSAGGGVTIRADHIDIAGTLRAPFGSIDLNADGTLTLQSGALVSVSGAGLTVPYGYTEAELAWYYALDATVGDTTRLAITEPSSKSVQLKGATVDQRSGATVDVSGGGDLLAWEWQKGSGGTTDVLAQAGTYAIVPSLGSSVAPSDWQNAQGSSLQVGDAVYLSGIAGLPAGYYTLLPAHYALLPGAYAIKLASGQTDMLASQNKVLANGSLLVAGRRVVSGTSLADSRSSGFVLMSGELVRASSQYVETSANQFFSSHLPVDAGLVTLIATQAMLLNGTVRLDASGERGAVSISAPQIEVVSSVAAVADSSGLQLSAGTLSDWQAGSLTLSGTAVTVANDAQHPLSAQALSLDATDTLTLADGSAVVGHETLSFSAVNIALAESAQVSTPALTVASQRINLGEAPSGAAGLNLTAAQLAQLSGSASAGTALSLQASDSVNLYGDFSLGGQPGGTLYLSTLTLDAPIVQSHGGAAVISAGSLTLQNSGASAADGSSAAADGTGALTLTSGGNLTLGAGTVRLQGLQQTTLQAAQDVVFAGSGALLVTGDVQLEAARVTASSGAAQSLQASGALLVVGNAQTASAIQSVSSGLGAKLSLSGASVTSSGFIDLNAGTLSLSADGNLTLAAGSVTRVLGQDQTFYDSSASASGGSITLSATQGNVNIGAGAELNVSGSAGGGAAGSLTIQATAGLLNLDAQALLLGQAQDGASGATFALDVNRIPAAGMLATLDAVLDAGGFTASRGVRARTGDLLIEAGQTWQANQLSFMADGGRLTVAGELLASGQQAGRIELWAGAGLTLAGTAHLQATGQGQDAATVVLGNSSATQLTDLQAGSRIDVGSATTDGADGGITLRAARTGIDSSHSGGTDVALSELQSTLTGVARVDIEAVQTYTGISSIGSTSGAGKLTESQVATDTTAFMAQADAVLARLGLGADERFHVTPGVEVQSSGDLTLASDWSLYSASRPGGEAGTLTLRAAGNLLINANLSDGFASTSSSAALQSGASWSYRLVGGADLSAANATSVNAGAGKVQLAAAKVVRTGTGSIDVAAGGDVVLGSGTSAFYTAGTVASALSGFTVPTGAVYSEGGGDVSVTALGNITALSASTQDTSNWLYRYGSGAGTSTWWVSFKDFAQNIGALGGGDVSLSAGGNISDVSAAVATNGRLARNESAPLVLGGGDLSVRAGGDIQGGVFATLSGTGALSAGGSISAGSLGLAPLLGLGSGAFKVQAAGSVMLDGVFNPTLLAPGNKGAQGVNNSYFSTYDADSSVTVLAWSGDVELGNNSAKARTQFKHNATWVGGEANAYVWYPGTVNVAALRGDVIIDKAMTLLPAADGGLSLMAYGSLQVLGTITEKDLNPTTELASALNPSRTSKLTGNGVTASGQSLLHEDDTEPVRLYALTGSVTGPSQSLLGQFVEPVAVRAGADIVNAGLTAEHFSASDVSVLEAANDVRFTSPLNASGGLATNNLGVTLAGPGTLEVSAGRNVDLGTSAGLITSGNLQNARLPSQGARIVVSVGLGRDEQGRLRLPAIAAFMSRYVLADTPDAAAYRHDLVAYLADLGLGTLSEAEALAAFQQLTMQQQLPFAAKVLYAELRAAGRAEATSGQVADYQRGYAAIAALFPASDYQGELRLYLSQIKTQRGGDISLLVPGGRVNEGLATPPASLSKTASQLGIVTLKGGSVQALASGDFLVNQSRVFTLAGGDILIWSSSGDIDAGKGAKSTAYAPAPTLITQADGTVEYDSSAAASGSGIAVLLTDPTLTAGATDLIAPRGTVDAGEAGIRAQGNLYIAALHVRGADNISVQGNAVGVPVVSAPAAGLTALRSDTDLASAVQQSLDALQSAAGPRGVTPSTFTVEVIGYGP
jgi:filamentous hemagglutinin family protein